MTDEEMEKVIESLRARMEPWYRMPKLPSVPLTYKRLVLWAARIGRRMASVGGTTPARADVLFALQYEERRQADLGVDLGVCRAVVSRMLIAMERLGLVERWVDPDDARHRVVRMTEVGRRAFEAIVGKVPRESPEANLHMTAEDTLRRVCEPVFVVADIEAKTPSKRNERTVCRWLHTLRPPTDFAINFEWTPLYYDAWLLPWDAQRKSLPLAG